MPIHSVNTMSMILAANKRRASKSLETTLYLTWSHETGEGPFLASLHRHSISWQAQCNQEQQKDWNAFFSQGHHWEQPALIFWTAAGAGEWVAGAGEGRPIVVASNHHGLVETELLADPLGTQEDTVSAAAADGKHKVCHRVPPLGFLWLLPCFCLQRESDVW